MQTRPATATGLPRRRPQQSFAVGKGSQTITFTTSFSGAVVSGPTYTPAATASSTLAVTLSIDASSSSVCSMTSGVVSFQTVGTCTIDANQAGDGNWIAAPQAQQSIAVGKGSQTITFPALPATAFTSTPPAPAATASSGLTVVYSTSTAGVCTVSTTGAISFVGAGTCTIDADQPGNSNYLAAAQVSQSFNVTAGTNTITFAALSNRALGSGSFTVSATASSGLTVTFSTTTPVNCSVVGTTVSLLAVGQCTIVAAQAGNANYVAAASVSQSFNITKAVTTVTLTVSDTSLYLGFPADAVGDRGRPVADRDGDVRRRRDQYRHRDGDRRQGQHGDQGPGARQSHPDRQLQRRHQQFGLRIGGGHRLGECAPDPSTDPDVIGLINAQASQATRLANNQIENLNSRMQELHDDNDNSAYDVSINLVTPDAGPIVDAYTSQPQNDAARSFGYTLGGVGRQQKTPPPFHLWAQGTINLGRVDSLGNITDTFQTSGITIGMDTRIASAVKAGLAFGYANDVTDVSTDGTRSKIDSFSAAAYMSYQFAPSMFLDIIGGAGKDSLNLTRFSAPGNVFLYGRRDATVLFGSVTLTAEHRFDHLKLAPYGRIDATDVIFDPYTETGSPFWALSYNRMTATSLSGTVGLDMTYDVPVPSGSLALSAGLADQFRLGGSYSQILGYADLANGQAYTVTGQADVSNQMSAHVGISTKAGGANIAAEYRFTAGNSGLRMHTVTLNVGVDF